MTTVDREIHIALKPDEIREMQHGATPLEEVIALDLLFMDPDIVWGWDGKSKDVDMIWAADPQRLHRVPLKCICIRYKPDQLQRAVQIVQNALGTNGWERRQPPPPKKCNDVINDIFGLGKNTYGTD